MTLIRAYNVNVTRAYRMDEQGQGWSLEPWKGNVADGGYYDGACTPIAVELDDRFHLAHAGSGALMVFPSGLGPARGYPLEEMRTVKGAVKRVREADIPEGDGVCTMCGFAGFNNECPEPPEGAHDGD